MVYNLVYRLGLAWFLAAAMPGIALACTFAFPFSHPSQYEQVRTHPHIVVARAYVEPYSRADQPDPLYGGSGTVWMEVISTLKGDIPTGTVMQIGDYWGELDAIYELDGDDGAASYDETCFTGFSRLGRYYLLFPYAIDGSYNVSWEDIELLSNDPDFSGQDHPSLTWVNFLLETSRVPEKMEQLAILAQRFHQAFASTDPHEQELADYIDAHLLDFNVWNPAQYLIEAYKAFGTGTALLIRGNHTSTALHDPYTNPIENPANYAECRVVQDTYSEDDSPYSMYASDDDSDSDDETFDPVKCKQETIARYRNRILKVMARGHYPEAMEIFEQLETDALHHELVVWQSLYFAKNGKSALAIRNIERTLSRLLSAGEHEQARNFIAELHEFKRHAEPDTKNCQDSDEAGYCEENSEELWEGLPELNHWWPHFILAAKRSSEGPSSLNHWGEDYEKELQITFSGDFPADPHHSAELAALNYAPAVEWMQSELKALIAAHEDNAELSEPRDQKTMKAAGWMMMRYYSTDRLIELACEYRPLKNLMVNHIGVVRGYYFAELAAALYATGLTDAQRSALIAAGNLWVKRWPYNKELKNVAAILEGSTSGPSREDACTN